MNDARGGVFVSGATGYIGSRLVHGLLELQRPVHVLLREDSDTTLLADVLDRVDLHRTTFEQAELQALFGDHGAKTLVHMASNFVAEHSPDQLPELLQSNIVLGTNLLEACVGSSVTQIVNTSTQWEFWKESDTSPVCLYAATKRAFQQVVDFYCSAYPIDVVTLALSDSYGPGDPRGKIVSRLIDLATSGERLAVSPGEQLIDLLHVDDIVSAFILLIQGMNGAEVEMYQGNRRYELYSGEPVTLKQLVSLVEKAVGKPLDIGWGEREYREREIFQPLHVSDPLPHWSPRIALADGIADVVRWDAAG